jgi:hypothetical protein
VEVWLYFKVRGGGFHLRNVNIVGFYYLFNCYMFRSYDHLHADIFSRIYSADNGTVLFFRILDIIVNGYSDRFNVSRLLIDMVAILWIKMRIVVAAIIWSMLLL